MILKGRVEIARVGDNEFEIRLGQPDWRKPGDSEMYYQIEFDADDYENISMEAGTPVGGKYPEWPPTKVGDKYVLQGVVLGFPWDKFKVVNLRVIEVSLWNPHDNTTRSFDAYYVDETVKPPKVEELKKDVKAIKVSFTTELPPVKAEEGVVKTIGGLVPIIVSATLTGIGEHL